MFYVLYCNFLQNCSIVKLVAKFKILKTVYDILMYDMTLVNYYKNEVQYNKFLFCYGIQPHVQYKWEKRFRDLRPFKMKIPFIIQISYSEEW